MSNRMMSEFTAGLDRSPSGVHGFCCDTGAASGSSSAAGMVWHAGGCKVRAAFVKLRHLAKHRFQVCGSTGGCVWWT